jgi:endonuclease/exonuclease/phosphatase family metal-dependent hydrolase
MNADKLLAATQHLRIISYNLKFHAAYCEIASLATSHAADIVCLQECRSADLEDKVGNLNLVGKTTVGAWGLAVYANRIHFEVLNAESYPLDTSLYERFRPDARDRLLIVTLLDRFTGQTLIVASLHATHLVATNHLRRKQIRSVIRILGRTADEHIPTIIVGDYNYPFFHGSLRKQVQRAGYDLIISDKHTIKKRFFRGHFDLASSIHTRETRVSTLPAGLSDHAPILINVTI